MQTGKTHAVSNLWRRERDRRREVLAAYILGAGALYLAGHVLAAVLAQ